MNEIISFYIARLKKYAFLEYSENFMNLVDGCNSIQEKMPRQVAALKEAYATVLEQAQKSQKSDLTDPIFVLDAQQDGIYTSIYHAVNAMRKSLNQETAAMATSLWNTLNSFRVRINIQYLQELGQMDNLLAVLQSTQIENIESLGLTSLFEELKRLNRDIHRLIDERKEEQTLKPEGKFEMARRAYEEQYHLFVKYVNAYYLVLVSEAQEPDESLSNFIRSSNTNIELFVRTQFNNSTGNGDGSDSSDDSDGDSPSIPDLPLPDDPESPSNPEQNPNPETPNPNPEPENPGGGNNGENNGGGTNTPDPNDPWYNPDDEPD